MNIQERINKRIANARRIADELNNVNSQIQTLTDKRNKLIEEAIGNNEALKELKELNESGA